MQEEKQYMEKKKDWSFPAKKEGCMAKLSFRLRENERKRKNCRNCTLVNDVRLEKERFVN